MSTWQLLPGDDGGYLWEISGEPPVAYPDNDGANGAPAHVHCSGSRLPSMSDLLLQGCSKLLGNDQSLTSGNLLMFRTGLGKSVALKQSSIAKAQSVLGGDDFPPIGHEVPKGGRPGNGSFFQTGSGKAVNVSSAGLLRAKTLLELDEDDKHFISQGSDISRTLPRNNGYRSQNPSPWEKGRADAADMVEREPVSGFKSAHLTGSAGNKLHRPFFPNSLPPKMHDLHAKPGAIKFQTAGGRSLSISSDALKRAKSLLGDPDLGSFLDEGRLCTDPSNKENEPSILLQNQGTPNSGDAMKRFVSPLKPFSFNGEYSSSSSKKIKEGCNLIAQFDAAASEFTDRSGSEGSFRRPLIDRSFSSCHPSVENNFESRSNNDATPPGQILVETSNGTRKKISSDDKNALGKRFTSNSSVSPFKRPRSSRFSTPLKKNSLLAPTGLSMNSLELPSRERVSTRYPLLLQRLSMKEYFRGPPLHMGCPDGVIISSHDAENFMFSDESGLNCVGPEAFFHMLIQSGASPQNISKLWVINHYRWIVWKLACYERYYPAKAGRKFFTITNVLEELKYRYEREVNHGHRSSIKRILEGDASPASMLVLCVSAISFISDPSDGLLTASEDNKNKVKVELTDGWYSVDAVLDALLSNYYSSGKLFVGQKLRIWGAKLSGWAAPVSPLEETKSVSLLLHANGTYRAHWADRLGFCKDRGVPLAFKCIKSNGGSVPQTLVGVTRLYPILYKESLRGGGAIVRSERMEMKVRHAHIQRRSEIIDSVHSEFHRAKEFHLYNDIDNEEGAKISKILETSAEPELLMAEMSPEQLNVYSNYCSKLEVSRQSDLESLIRKALQDAGWNDRDVVPFMRMRVVGLRSLSCRSNNGPEQGLITIWSPTESQQHDLVEGQAYIFSGLNPINSHSDTIYLQGRGSTIKWRPLKSHEFENFRPFSNPREAISLSRLGEIALSSEFDIAGLVIHVGEVFTTSQQRRQWVFVTDGSISGESSNSLLAINFCSHYLDDSSFAPMNSNLVGSTVGFCNLIKRAKDQINQLWLAEATENSTYFLSFNSPLCSHLSVAALSNQRWAKISETTIRKLQERVLFITGDTRG